MTVDELKKALENVPGNYEIRFEHETGTYTYTEVMARGIVVSSSARCVLLTETVELQDYLEPVFNSK